MVLSQVCIEILEYLLTHQAAFKTIGQSVQDALDVRFSRNETPACNNVNSLNFKAQGTWTSLLSCKGILDLCPNLASVLGESFPKTTGETEVCGDVACVRLTAVNQSKEDSYTVTMQRGRLDVNHEEACLAADNAQTSVNITLECLSTMEELMTCAMAVRNFLFKFKLVHPKTSVGLSSNSDELDFNNFEEREYEFTSICHGINLITDPKYYFIPDGVQGTPCHHLRPVSEGSFVFLSPSLSSSESCFSVRCVAVATLIPPSSPLQAQAATPSQLWLSVYGPGSFPLAHPASSPMETWLNLKHLVKWKELGLAPAAGGEMEAGPGSPNLPIRDCFKADLQTSFSGSTNPSEPLHIIHLILFFKENFKGSTMTAQDRLELLNQVRQEFPHICAQQLSRIQKITHDTLAKLLGSSRPARKDRVAIMKSAVPSIKSSLHKIISHSANDAFRRRCLDAVQADTCMELTDRLSNHLSALCERPNSQHRNLHSQSAVNSQSQFPCEGDDEDGGKVPSDDFNQASSSDASSSYSFWMPPHQETAHETLLTEENKDDADFDFLDETRPPLPDSMRVNQDNHPARHSASLPTSCPQPSRDQSSPFTKTPPIKPYSMLSQVSASGQIPSSIEERWVRPSEMRQSASQRSEAMVSSSSRLPKASPQGSNQWTPCSPSSAEERQKRPSGRRQSASRTSEARLSSSSKHPVVSPPESNQWTSCLPTPLPSESPSQYQTCDDGSMDPDGMGASSGKPEAMPIPGDEEDEVKDNDVQMMQEHLAGEVGNDWFETLMDHDDWMNNEI